MVDFSIQELCFIESVLYQEKRVLEDENQGHTSRYRNACLLLVKIEKYVDLLGECVKEFNLNKQL